MRTHYENSAIHKPFNVPEPMSADEETRYLARIREDALMNEKYEMDAARRKGREEGLKEAREEAREEARKEARKEAREEAREEARKEAREEARKEGRKEGRKERDHEIALKMLDEGMKPEMIMKYTALSADEITALKKKAKK